MFKSSFTSLALFATLVAGECRLSDITSIVGGEYTVNSITAQHIEVAEYKMDFRLISRIAKMIMDIREFVKQTRQISYAEIEDFKVTKADATIDLKGTFISKQISFAKDLIKSRLADNV